MPKKPLEHEKPIALHGTNLLTQKWAQTGGTKLISAATGMLGVKCGIKLPGGGVPFQLLFVTFLVFILQQSVTKATWQVPSSWSGAVEAELRTLDVALC